MRVVAPFFAVLASCVTIFAGIVRLWWSKPTVTPKGQPDMPPKAPGWVSQLAKWWLIVVVIGATVILFVSVIYTIVSLS